MVPSPETEPDGRDRPAKARKRRGHHGSTVDEVSDWSFPASDPPQSWTWDIDPPAAPPAARKER